MAMADDMGKLSMLTGPWKFKAGNPDAMITGVFEDTDYLDIGYWLKVTAKLGSEGRAAERVFHFLPHTMSSNPYTGDLAKVTGTATYDGVATGVYVKKVNVDGQMVPDMGGQFGAKAMLMAEFGSTLKISGTVSDFMYQMENEDGTMTVQPIDSNWSLNLANGIVADSGGFKGMTTGDGSAIGAWSGQFHGNTGTDSAMPMQPSAVVGTFDGHFWNGHVGGAFGARMMEPTGN